jgi:anti-anti-sigma factor
MAAGLDIILKPLKGEDNAALAEMSGAIDGNTVPNFQNTLEEIQQKGVQCLILDMSKIKYVNSTGLGSLVKYADTFKNSGGGMALIKVPAKVKIVIEMLGLNAFFDICPDIESARQALSGGLEPAGKAPEKKAPEKPKLKKPKPKVAKPPSKPQAKEAPVGATSTGPVNYPYVINCQSCGVKIEFPKKGSYKCPRCHTLVQLNGSGGPVFSKPSGTATVSVSLPARSECGEGLLHLATTVCAAKLGGPALDALRLSVHEVVQVIQNSIYANNPDGIYHVSIDLNNGKAEIRIADHGASVDTARLPLYFPNATRYMDTFECVAHPKGGNVIRMTKAG